MKKFNRLVEEAYAAMYQPLNEKSTLLQAGLDKDIFDKIIAQKIIPSYDAKWTKLLKISEATKFISSYLDEHYSAKPLIIVKAKNGDAKFLRLYRSSMGSKLYWEVIVFLANGKTTSEKQLGQKAFKRNLKGANTIFVSFEKGVESQRAAWADKPFENFENLGMLSNIKSAMAKLIDKKSKIIVEKLKDRIAVLVRNEQYDDIKKLSQSIKELTDVLDDGNYINLATSENILNGAFDHWSGDPVWKHEWEQAQENYRYKSKYSSESFESVLEDALYDSDLARVANTFEITIAMGDTDAIKPIIYKIAMKFVNTITEHYDNIMA